MFPQGLDYIFTLISKGSPVSNRLAVLPVGIVVEPDSCEAWLLIVFVFHVQSFQQLKRFIVSALLHRPAVVSFTGCTTTQNELWYIGVVTFTAERLVLRIATVVISNQLLSDVSTTHRTFRLQQFPKFILFRRRAEVDMEICRCCKFTMLSHVS